MSRVALLALLTFALSTIAAADTHMIRYHNADLGPLPPTADPTVGSPLIIVSPLVTITDVTNNIVTPAPSGSEVTIITGTLMTTPSSNNFAFSEGSVTITSGSTTLFSGTFAHELINGISEGEGPGGWLWYTLSGTLTPDGGGVAFVSESCFASRGFGYSCVGDTIITPEPGTLALLGTGMIGLAPIAGATRRKLNNRKCLRTWWS